jgi:hypothetical protein
MRLALVAAGTALALSAAAFPPPRVLVPMTVPPDSLALVLRVPPEARPGRTVSFRLEVRNTAGRPVDLYLTGRTATVEVTVTGPDGAVVWRRLDGEAVPAVLHLRVLAAGETLALEVEWDQRTRAGRPAPPGEYSARAILLAEGGGLAAPAVTFRVAGRLGGPAGG